MRGFFPAIKLRLILRLMNGGGVKREESPKAMDTFSVSSAVWPGAIGHEIVVYTPDGGTVERGDGARKQGTSGEYL